MINDRDIESMRSLINDISFYNDNKKSIINVDQKIIDNIENYSNFINSDNKKQNYEIDDIFSKITDNFNLIYESILNQTNDKKFTYFIEELKELTKQYLNNLKFYYTSVNKKINNKNELDQKKFFFDKLDIRSVDKILLLADKEINYIKNNLNLGKKTREELSVNKGPAIRKIINTLNSQFYKMGILKKVSDYMKKDYIVTGCALELSVPSANWWKNLNQKLPSKTWYAHVDESFLYPKSICYLTNVNEKNGPTSFFENGLEMLKINYVQNILGRIVNNIGINKKSKLYNFYNNKNGNKALYCQNFKSHFASLPDSIKFNSHFGWYVNPNSMLENELCKKEIVLKGEKGTLVVFDGANLLHRGGLLVEGERLVLQIIFGPRVNLIKKVFDKIKRSISY